MKKESAFIVLPTVVGSTLSALGTMMNLSMAHNLGRSVLKNLYFKPKNYKKIFKDFGKHINTKPVLYGTGGGLMGSYLGHKLGKSLGGTGRIGAVAGGLAGGLLGKYLGDTK
jgi:hypothetical protein